MPLLRAGSTSAFCADEKKPRGESGLSVCSLLARLGGDGVGLLMLYLYLGAEPVI